MNRALLFRDPAMAVVAAMILANGIGCDRWLPRTPRAADGEPSAAPMREEPRPPAPPTFPVQQHADKSQLEETGNLPPTQAPLGDAAVPPGATGSSPAATPSRRETPSVNRSAGAAGSTSRSGVQTGGSARLSAGVALPQSLPDGTAMGFSVDYVLPGNLPTSASRTVWLIESAKGGSVVIPVVLAAKGNLSTFVQRMRPEHGPFQSYLAILMPDGRQLPISPKITMKSY